MSETNPIPAHLGIIMDGNRRWAKENGLPTLEGHQRGAEVFKEIALGAFERGIKYLSAFVFSTENWSRTEEEVGYLMNLVMKAVENYLDEFNEHGIRIVVLGRREGIREKVLEAIKNTEEKTKNNPKGTLALCFNYGGLEELVDAIKSIVAAGTAAEAVSSETLRNALYSPEVPDVDLLIRTSGEYRTSGFMLARAAYAELYFAEKYWPDFTLGDLDAALAEYAKRERRFGG
jgi:undecaprenyl diphosphate synthase